MIYVCNTSGRRCTKMPSHIQPANAKYGVLLRFDVHARERAVQERSLW